MHYIYIKIISSIYNSIIIFLNNILLIDETEL